jgi:hypothetical protein
MTAKKKKKAVRAATLHQRNVTLTGRSGSPSTLFLSMNDGCTYNIAPIDSLRDDKLHVLFPGVFFEPPIINSPWKKTLECFAGHSRHLVNKRKEKPQR